MTQGIPEDKSKQSSRSISPPLKKKTRFLGRLFGQSNKKPLPKAVEKVVVTYENQHAKETVIKIETSARQRKYDNNYKKILDLKTSNDLKSLAVKNGEFVIADNIGLHKPNEVLDLVRQTRREAWGRVIDAEHGFRVKEFELQKLDTLNTQLKKICPEAFPEADSQHPLKILSGKYRSQDLSQIPDSPEKTQLQEAIQKSETATKSKISTIRMRLLGTKPVTRQGLNPTEFITEELTSNAVALSKTKEDKVYGHLVARMMQVKDLDKEKKYSTLAGFNESLMSHLNILFGGGLGIPLTTTNDEDKLISTFVKNKGSFHDVRKQEGLDFVEKMPIERSQEFVFAQIISGNTDCHSNNILIGPNYEPIGIDFGRILPPSVDASEARMRAAYLQFPCLDQPINSKDKEFYKKLDVDKTVSLVEELLRKEQPEKFNDPDLKPIVEKSLTKLRARLYMVKIGVEMGLTQRQLLALDFPPISALEDLNKFTDYSLLLHLGSNGFRLAWKVAHFEGPFDKDLFEITIKKDVSSVFKT